MSNESLVAESSSTGALPAGTREVEIELTLPWTSGENDGYADNLSFSLSAVPEPQSVVMLMTALIFFSAARTGWMR